MAEEERIGFDNFGYVSYVKQTKINPFVEYLKQGQLMGTKCQKCGTVYFPPRADCTSCIFDEIEWIEVNGAAKLVTFTEVNFAPTGFQEEVPYVLALGRLSGGQQVFARIAKSIPIEQIQIGMDLQLVPVVLNDEHVIYEFKKP